MHPQTQKSSGLRVQRPGRGVWLSPVRLFCICFKVSFFFSLLGFVFRFSFCFGNSSQGITMNTVNLFSSGSDSLPLLS